MFSAEDFRKAILQLLPRGPAWSRDVDGVTSRLAAAWGLTFARNASRAVNLIADAFPANATELLPEWEASLGLPDPCAGADPSIGSRRAQVVARLTDSGGSSVAYYVRFAQALGFQITITEFVPARFGQTKFGTPYYGNDWAFVWQINCTSAQVFAAQFGSSRFGDPYRSWGGQVLICELSARAPAHTRLLFNWTNGSPAWPDQFILNANTLG